MQWSNFQSVVQFYAAANLAVIALGEFKRKEWKNIGDEITSHKSEARNHYRRLFDLSFDCGEIGNTEGRTRCRELAKKAEKFEDNFSKGYIFYSGVGRGISRKEAANNIFAIALSIFYLGLLLHSSFNADNRITNIVAWTISLLGFVPIVLQILITWTMASTARGIKSTYVGNWRFDSAELTLEWSKISNENREIVESKKVSPSSPDP